MTFTDVLNSEVVASSLIALAALAWRWLSGRDKSAERKEQDRKEFIRGMFDVCFRAVETWSRAEPGAPGTAKLARFLDLIRKAWVSRYGDNLPMEIRLQAVDYAERHALIAKAVTVEDSKFAQVLAAVQDAAKKALEKSEP